MQNVHRTIANSLWVAKTHWIYKESIYHLVFSRPSGVGHQTAALFRPTWPSLPDRLQLIKFYSQASRDFCDIFCDLLQAIPGVGQGHAKWMYFCNRLAYMKL